jgi:hypothetical protein
VHVGPASCEYRVNNGEGGAPVDAVVCTATLWRHSGTLAQGSATQPSVVRGTAVRQPGCAAARLSQLRCRDAAMVAIVDVAPVSGSGVVRMLRS